MVSIVITTKNAEEFIADCIESVINSNYIKAGGNFEIILVDNYSTDKTVEIAKSLGAKNFFKMYFLLCLRGCVYVLAKFNISKKESVYEKK